MENRISGSGKVLTRTLCGIFRPRRSVCFFFSVGYISRSGGLSNELNNIIARNTDGVNEGIAIGGDRYMLTGAPHNGCSENSRKVPRKISQVKCSF